MYGQGLKMLFSGRLGRNFSTLKNSDEDNIIYKGGYIRVIRSFQTASVASGNIVNELFGGFTVSRNSDRGNRLAPECR